MKVSSRYMKIISAESERQRDSTPLSRVFRHFEILLQKSPVSIQQFDRILMQVDNGIKGAYQSSVIDENERKIIESDMVIQCEIPLVLIEPIKQLLFQTIASIKEEINEAELHFMDISRLGLTSDNYSKRRNRIDPIDSMTKLPLRKDAKIRRCTRCCSLMQDLIQHKSSNPVLGLIARYCYCGSPWMILEGYELDHQVI